MEIGNLILKEGLIVYVKNKRNFENENFYYQFLEGKLDSKVVNDSYTPLPSTPTPTHFSTPSIQGVHWYCALHNK